MFPRTSRPLALGASAALATAGLLLATPSLASAADAPSNVAFTATAYGSTANATLGSTTITSGKTAYFGTCSPVPGAEYGNNVAEITDLGSGLGTLGAIVTKGTTTDSSVTVTSTVADAKLLGNVITATEIKSTSTSSVDGSTPSSTGSTTITGLKILGFGRTVPVGANSRISVAGIANIYFNRQTAGSTLGGRSQLTVDAMRVDIIKNNKLGLPSGTIVLGSSTSGVHAPTFYRASGAAYGTQLSVAGLLNSGPSANVGLPCGGSGGAIVKNNVAGVEVPGNILKVGAVTSTGQSVEGDGTTTATFTNTTADVNLLNGVVKADAIKVRASTTRGNAGLTENTTDGTEITNLSINGSPVTVTSKDNSKIEIEGVGTLTIRKTVRYTTGIDSIGLELKLNTEQLGLPSGTVLQVAAAKSRVTTN